MRSFVFAVTAALLTATAACDPASAGHSAARTPTATPSPPPPLPSGTSSASPPVRHGTVRNYDTRFSVSVASVRTAVSFGRAGKHERAKAGERLVIVMITARNIGRHPSRLDFGNDEPVDLVGTDGRTYYPRMSFGVPDEGVFPGRSLTDPYVFPVPAGTKPAHAVVTLFGGVGFPSTVDLKMP